MKKSKVLKVIRIFVFLIILIMFINEAGDALAKYLDAIKIRNMLYKTLPITFFSFIVLIIILIREPGIAAKRVTILDILSIVMFIVLMSLLKKDLTSYNEIATSFQGNNTYVPFYSEGINGVKGYDDLEKALEDRIEYVMRTGYTKYGRTVTYHKELEEIYRIQTEEKIFVYCKIDDEYIAEFDFVVRDDLYYCLGEMDVEYIGLFCSDEHTAEETIRTDIAYTMWREGIRVLEGAPAWGVSTDENIFSMTINSENVDDVILINEIDGKKYYFWITTNVDGIETIDDVKAAEIKM